jgi:hypothetical protein
MEHIVRRHLNSLSTNKYEKIQLKIRWIQRRIQDLPSIEEKSDASKKQGRVACPSRKEMKQKKRQERFSRLSQVDRLN